MISSTCKQPTTPSLSDALSAKTGLGVKRRKRLAYRELLLPLGHLGAELELGGDRHGLEGGDPGLQQVVLHDVAAELVEEAQVAGQPVGLDGARQARVSAEAKDIVTSSAN